MLYMTAPGYREFTGVEVYPAATFRLSYSRCRDVDSIVFIALCAAGYRSARSSRRAVMRH